MGVLTRTNSVWTQIPIDSKKTTAKHRRIILRRELQAKISFSPRYSASCTGTLLPKYLNPNNEGSQGHHKAQQNDAKPMRPVGFGVSRALSAVE